ncbi:AAA domain-containing protein [Porphyromonadaceae sp. NP-X]|jgi:superfamily I DNA and/or RNA helicase|nr:AAA domain-containing protein [Porphyromonadaceae sp. NP-X]
MNKPLKKELIYIDGNNKTDDIDSYRFIGLGSNKDKCAIKFKNNDKEYVYSANKVNIVKSAINSEKSNNLFQYLNQIADAVGLTTEEGKNILADSYSSITFIPEYSILANFLNGEQPTANNCSKPIEIFPFGFNLSQKEAVNKAFSSPLSVIEGPPGTGKTQTILNVIANAVMNGQSVAVVSSNNSATKNVYEKLLKNGIECIAALLGNSTNKKEFIDSQTDIPDLLQFNLSDKEKSDIKQTCENLFNQLSEYLRQKNELALLKQEIDCLTTEYKHFQDENKIENDIEFLKNTTADKLLGLWVAIENHTLTNKKLTWWRKLLYWFKYGRKQKYLFNIPAEKAILICQSNYYPVKIEELRNRQNALEISLNRFSFDSKMKEYSQLSMQLFKSELYKKYNRSKREKYEINQLRSNSEKFLKDYPVIMSTTYSLRRSLSEEIMYDFVIIDESSQVDLSTGALALSCAKRAVIVGDLKQLPNVVDNRMKEKTDAVFNDFSIPESYRYSNHSLLSSILEIFPNIPKTLLREHYRCHPKIIEFCNQKFYNNQLIILTNSESEREPLIVYKTVVGNHAREKTNQRQIDMIINEIIPNEKLEGIDLGIVTPYRNQTNALQQAFNGTEIKADTVDKFQGRENDVIILSTVDNEISEFTDNPNRLNVAISRAIKQLILVVNGNDSDKDSNIADLIRYIEYNNFSVKESKLRSIFDYLYKGYEQKRTEILSKIGNISDFESEKLMYALISNTLKQDKFSKYDVVLHFPLRNVIRDFYKLTEEEQKYARHYNTHLDFLIYNKLGKNPILAIEVDGYEFHKAGTEQADRDKLKDSILAKYKLPLFRFSTVGSGEKPKLIDKLTEITTN